MKEVYNTFCKKTWGNVTAKKFYIIVRSKVSYFFLRGHGRWSFIHSNPKIVCFFFREAEKSGKKKHKLVFFFPGKVHRSFIRIFNDFLSFLIKNGCVFFFPKICVFFCVFFFPGKVHMPFIHSIFGAEKKNTTREKKKNSFFIHSFDIPQKCTKTNFSGEIKKYGTFDLIQDPL